MQSVLLSHFFPRDIPDLDAAVYEGFCLEAGGPEVNAQLGYYETRSFPRPDGIPVNIFILPLMSRSGLMLGYNVKIRSYLLINLLSEVTSDLRRDRFTVLESTHTPFILPMLGKCVDVIHGYSLAKNLLQAVALGCSYLHSDSIKGSL